MAGKHAKRPAPRMRQLGVAAATTGACAGAFVALPSAAATTGAAEVPPPAFDGGDTATQFIPPQATAAQQVFTVPQQRPPTDVQRFFLPAPPFQPPAEVSEQARREARGQQVLEEAAKHEGKPYEYGADGPDAFDCSGFTKYVFEQVGVELPRTSQQQADAVESIPEDQAMPGDLIFFSSGGGVYHVAIYAGNNQMWTAPQSGDSVKLDEIFDDYTVGRPS